MNAISNITLVTKILLPILAIVSIWLLSGGNTQKNSSAEEQQSRSSDYAMTDFTLTIMDDEGNPSRVVNGSKMAHYPDDDRTEIISLVASVLDDQKDNWIMSSNKAQGTNEQILLTGDVIIARQDNNEIELHTEELTLDTQYNTAYTDLAVSIKSPYGNTDSVGLHIAFENKIINLHSRVKGHYNAPYSQ